MTKNNNRQSGSPRPMPSGLSAFHIEADRTSRGMAIVLGGIIGISDFSDSSILLRSHGGRIAVNGRALFINVYENHTVEIVGKVEEIVFKYGKN
ncbi:MAG: YabP/YqfC family sporulation protein [Clostridia bacterium]|nr:YabP/YqfC family sporulation protein [Clostridia bacterium]